ncbi:hypothetical protein FRB93_001758 [Tulasnella sp. JGI-2019a]|nr:hypothetical protein FRB93_001758 [Tulasnella sp. JGI-2019a]
MGRRKAELETVRDDCEHAGASQAIAVVGDFTAVEDIVAARENIARELSGLDTLIVAAGVSSLQPLITGVAKAERDADGHFAPGAPSKDAVQRVQDVAARAMTANYVGPLLTAVTFIPMLELTSKAPAILLIASAASIIPAPTRSLYCSTKGATLLLYQSLAIEHPRIKFSNVLPATVEGNFRAGAVDAGPVRENLGSALKKDYVAKECIASVDSGKTNVILPISYRAAHALYWIYPSLVHRFAKNKYNFN